MFSLSRNPQHHEHRIAGSTVKTSYWWTEQAKEEFALLRATEPHHTLSDLVARVEAFASATNARCVSRSVVESYFRKGGN